MQRDGLSGEAYLGDTVTFNDMTFKIVEQTYNTVTVVYNPDDFAQFCYQYCYDGKCHAEPKDEPVEDAGINGPTGSFVDTYVDLVDVDGLSEVTLNHYQGFLCNNHVYYFYSDAQEITFYGRNLGEGPSAASRVGVNGISDGAIDPIAQFSNRLTSSSDNYQCNGALLEVIAVDVSADTITIKISSSEDMSTSTEEIEDQEEAFTCNTAGEEVTTMCCEGLTELEQYDTSCTVTSTICSSSVCGDGVCSNHESTCGCEADCLNHKCDVGTNDCDDGNPCTVDSCSGSPRECSNSEPEGCISGDSCISVGAVAGTQYCGADGEIKSLKDAGECTQNYECSDGTCQEGICEKVTFFKKIGMLIRKIF